MLVGKTSQLLPFQSGPSSVSRVAFHPGPSSIPPPSSAPCWIHCVGSTPGRSLRELKFNGGGWCWKVGRDTSSNNKTDLGIGIFGLVTKNVMIKT